MIADVPRVTIPAKAIRTYHNGLIGSMMSFKPLTSANWTMTEFSNPDSIVALVLCSSLMVMKLFHLLPYN